jgi:dethiobiotin synthetase
MSIKGIFVTGTDTGVGKTFVTAGIAAILNAELARGVSIWKPVQSGAVLGNPGSDSYRLKMGSGVDQAESNVATLSFKAPLAPWIAAENEGKGIDFTALVEEGKRRLKDSKFLVVEGAGGLAVPLTEKETITTLAQELRLPVLIVARPGLGTVNHTVLTISYAQQMGLKVLGVIMNNYHPNEEADLADNAMMIEHLSGVSVIGKLPHFPFNVEQEEDWEEWRKRWVSIMEENVDISKIKNFIKNGGIHND